MSARAGPLFTIGHSNRSLESVISMLRDAGADMVVDVRRFPLSRTNPQFNNDVLRTELPSRQIGYEHWPDLGGRRKAQAQIADATNAYWQNRSFHNYADYALTVPFQAAIANLVELARDRAPALMCSEAVWWRCHRRIIADYLLARQIEVRHILDFGKITPAGMTPGAKPLADGSVLYPGGDGCMFRSHPRSGGGMA